MYSTRLLYSSLVQQFAWHEQGDGKFLYWMSRPLCFLGSLSEWYSSEFNEPLSLYTRSTSSSQNRQHVDHRTLHTLNFFSLYFPFTTYRRLAQGLAELAAGNGTMIFEMTQMAVSPPFECSEDPPKVVEQTEAQTDIFCNDGVNISADLQSTQKHFEMLSKTSEFGNILASVRTYCA